jgi:hypothetical protein
MTEHYLFYTVGNRDLLIDGKVPTGPGFRSACEEFKALIDADPGQVSRLQAPQLKNCLDHLLRVEGVGELTKVYLVVTDQNPDPQYRESDTAAAGELLVSWLESLRSQKDYARLLGKTAFRRLTLAGINPSDYAAVYRRLRAGLPRLEAGVFWVHPVSGTPAMTMGLVLAAAGRWGEAVQVLFQTPHLPVEKSPITLEIFAEAVRTRLLDRLERLDFAGAAALAGAGPGGAGPAGWLPAYQAEAVGLLVMSGLERSRFNFAGADRWLAEAVVRISDEALREEVRSLRLELRPLLETPDSAAATRPFLVELIFNARACWMAGREVDFLGRAYRLQEGLARFLLESLGFPTDEAPSRRDETRRRFWERAAELGLREALPVDPAVQFGGSINRPAMLGVLRALVGRRPAGLDLGLAEEFLPWLEGVLDGLSTLRNRTILGHGFEPVERGEVERLVREGTGLEVGEWLKRMACTLNPEARDPFAATVSVVRRMLGG